MRKNGFFGLLVMPSLGLLGGCGTVTAVVPDAEGVEHLSAVGLSCSNPYELTQDCSGFSGAKQLVDLGDFKCKIAGTEDGTVVFMMGAKPNSDAWSGKSTEKANAAYELTKKILLDNGISVLTAEPVSSGALLAGYIITTDGNAYELLSTYAVEK